MPRYSKSQLAAIALILDEDEEIYVRRRQWVHKAWRKREEEGEFATLYKHLLDDETKFFEYFRMSKHCFDILLSKLTEKLRKQDTHWRKAIPPRERLAVCLRYILDNPKLIHHRGVLDVGCGCGAGAIAAASRNAKKVVANDIDPFAVTAAKINAELNLTKIDTDIDNYIGKSCKDFDVILIGDMFYDEQLASVLFEWLNKLTADDKLILIGDPGRHGLTESRRNQMTLLASYELPKETREENNGFTHTTVWRLNKL